MPRALTKNELEQLHLEPGEAVLCEVERNPMPVWIALAALGAAVLVYAINDPRYGWGVMFLSMVALAFAGGAVFSMRLFVTDRRIVRIGSAGKRSIARHGAKVAWAASAFGETLTVTADGKPLTMRFVRNADDVRAKLAMKVAV